MQGPPSPMWHVRVSVWGVSPRAGAVHNSYYMNDNTLIPKAVMPDQRSSPCDIFRFVKLHLLFYTLPRCVSVPVDVVVLCGSD